MCMLRGASEDFIVPFYLPIVVEPSNKCPPSYNVSNQGPIFTWFTWFTWVTWFTWLTSCVRQGQHLVNRLSKLFRRTVKYVAEISEDGS